MRCCGKRKEDVLVVVALLVKERSKGRNLQSVECIKSEHSEQSTQLFGRSKWRKDHTLHALNLELVKASRGSPGMLKCQGSLARLQKRSPCWVPRSAGVGREESLPASVLCAAWRGVGSRRLGASQGLAATAFRGGSPCLAGCGGAERSSSWRSAARPSQEGKAVPGRLLGSRDGCLDWEGDSAVEHAH